jgi:signal transduction histidine kinase
VAVIDPHRAPTTRALVLPRIENAVADGRTLAPLTQAALPPRTSTLQIDYAALSLSAASKLRFRYMLEGFSADWVYAGERRQTFYTNLPPGRYRFRVAATTDDLWKEPEAVWAFSVRPAFYQSAWFYLLCATAVGSLAAAYWALSVRAVRNRYAVVVAERTRVSREIHDTLLQSLGAVGLELEVVASQLTSSHSSTSDALRRLRRQVGECIAETRQSIWDLRSPSLERRDLGEAVRALAGTVKPGQAQVDVMVEGRPWSCPLEVQEELLRIGREAINNAVRHGCARSIQVNLEYRRGSLRLRVSDDGSGFNPADVPTAGGHCGLLNMKERAARVGGRFTVTSHPGSGTVVEAVVPVASAA